MTKIICDAPSHNHLGAWRGIESAPQDGTVVDLWVVEILIDEAGVVIRKDGERIANAEWGRPWSEPSGNADATWVTDFNPHAAPYLPAPVVRTNGAGRLVATHWMPLPAPPTT